METLEKDSSETEIHIPATVSDGETVSSAYLSVEFVSAATDAPSADLQTMYDDQSLSRTFAFQEAEVLSGSNDHK